MLHKKCPWCGEKILPAHLGRRLSKSPPKWYGFTRYVAVCPHCGGLVKQSRKGQAWVLLLLPVFGLHFFELLTGIKPWHATALHWSLLGLGIVGIVASAILGVLEKAYDP